MSRKVMPENSLATHYPHLNEEWHPTNNGNLTPHSVSRGSEKYVWWRCKEGHEWEAKILNRSINGRGCPICYREKQNLKPLLELNLEFIQEWHPTKNGDLTPQLVIPNKKKIWWKGESCGHEWEATIQNRRSGTGCPYCAGKKISFERSLAHLNPELADEWHPTKNYGLTPDKVFANSSKKVMWLGKCGHEWQATISSRNRGNGCESCRLEKRTSFPEQAIYYYLKQIFEDTKNRYKHEKITRKPEVDVYIPSLKLGIEYDGYRHNTKKMKQKDESKNKLMQQHHIQLIRVREIGLPVLDSYGCISFLHEFKVHYGDNYYQTLKDCLSRILDFIIKNYPLTQGLMEAIHRFENVNIKMDASMIEEQMQRIKKEQSLLVTHPDIAGQWHPELNGNITPEHVTYGSSKLFWWFCENGHSFQEKPSHRVRGNGCHYCSNRRVNEENNLARLHPELVKEWNWEKNETSPEEVVPGTPDKVWWKCQIKGHEWQAEVRNRVNGNQCPYCRGKKVSADNCLAVKRPELAKQWHPTKNGSKTPYDVMPSTAKKYWWRCENNHEWEKSPNSRSKDASCPYCNQSLPSPEYNFAALYPELAKEWHPTKNKELSPKQVTPRSGQKVWWKCRANHEWEDTIHLRTITSGCPYCRGKRVTKNNCLAAAQNPVLAKQWHPTKNGDKTPYDVFPGSNKKVWWMCENHHVWESSPNNRSKSPDYACPYCTGRKKVPPKG